MRWLAGALVLLVTGLVLKLGLLVYAMYVLLGVLIASRYFSRRWMESLEVERSSSGSAMEQGETVEVTLVMRSKRRVPWVLVEDALPLEALTHVPPRLRTKGARMHLLNFGAGEQKVIRYQVECLLRGFYQMGPLLLETGDLFGLHRRYRVVTEPKYVLVYPKVVWVEQYELASRRPVGEIKMTHRLFEDPTRISGVRPYQHGDALNRIHWRASARTGELHSKTYEASSVAGATILLDFHRESYRGRGERARAELAVTTAASLAHAIWQMGEQAGLFTNGQDAAERIRLGGDPGEFRSRSRARARLHEDQRRENWAPVLVETRRATDQFERIREVLARVELSERRSLAELIGETGSRMPLNATVIAVLSDVTEETAVALGHLRRRGYAVTALVIAFEETSYHRWAEAPEWAGRLLAEHIEFRMVADEAAVGRVCGELFVR